MKLKKLLWKLSSAVVKQQTLEEVLLEYVRKCNGEIDLSKCSNELKTSNKEIDACP